MSQDNDAVDPTADSYYDRLGLSRDAHPNVVSQRIKALGPEIDRSIALTHAASTLTEPMSRRVYDRFVEDLGDDLGTQAFELWQTRDASNPESWLNGFKSTLTDDELQAADTDSKADADAGTDTEETTASSTASEDTSITVPDDTETLNPLYDGTTSSGVQ
jgi:hypothetical protein